MMLRWEANRGLYHVILAPNRVYTRYIARDIGTPIDSSNNPYSLTGLLTKGILDSLSAWILVYIALVDLIAADFLSKSMSCNFRLQVIAYFMLFPGVGLMASLNLDLFFYIRLDYSSLHFCATIILFKFFQEKKWC